MRDSKITKSNIILQLATLMLFLVLFSACLVPGIYAKYISSAESEGGTRVAKFEVKMLADPEASGTLLNGFAEEEKNYDIKSYHFSIIGNSEVTVKYSITVHFSNSLPEGIIPTVKIKDKADVNGVANASRNTFSFTSDDFILTSINQTNQHTLNITVNYYDENKNLLDVELTDTSVRISVEAQQVD